MFLSMGGFNMLMLARGILVYEITDDNAVISALVSIGWAPGLLTVSLFGGVLGDRLERRMLIQLSQLLNVLSAFTVGMLILFDIVEWWHLMIVSMMQGCMFALQIPARTAAMAQIVSRNLLPNAMALNAMAMTMMTIASPALGGLLYQWIEPEGVYFTVTAIMLAALFFTSLLPKLYPDGTNVKESTLKSIEAGLRYVLKNKLVMILLIQAVVIAMLSMPFRMLVPVFAKELYGSLPSEVGGLATMAGLGGLVATIGVASLRRGQRRGWVLLIAPVISAIALLVIGSLQFYWVGMFMFIGIGFGEAIRWALGQALVVEYSDSAYRARMTSLTMMTYGLIPIAALPMGVLVEEMGVTFAVVGMGICLLAASLIFIAISPVIRRLR